MNVRLWLWARDYRECHICTTVSGEWHREYHREWNLRLESGEMERHGDTAMGAPMPLPKVSPPTIATCRT